MKKSFLNIDQQLFSFRNLKFLSVFFIMFTIVLRVGLLSKDTVDVLSPNLTKNSNCSNFLVNVSDNRSYNIDNDKFHLDVGITDPPILYPQFSKNFSEIYASTFEHGKYNYDFSFRLSVLDPFQDAKALFVVTDAAKNFTFDSVVYKAEKVNIAPVHLGFGSVFVGKSSELSAQVINVSDFDVHIKNIYLKNGTLFKLDNNFTNFNLKKDSSVKLFVSYIPNTDNYIDIIGDVDSLIVETTCLRYVMTITGQGVTPSIIVEDFDFDAVEIGTVATTGVGRYKGLSIFNSGTGRLFIYGNYPLEVESPFSVNQLTNPNINYLEINPWNEKLISGINFVPEQIGEFIEPLIFKNNANGPDSIAYLRGIAYKPGAHFKSLNLGRIRIGDSAKGFITIFNSSTKPVSIDNFDFSTLQSDFKILPSESVPPFNDGESIEIYPDLPEFENKLKEYRLMVQFTPQSEFLKESKIIPVFPFNSDYKTGEVFNYVRGYGYLPKIYAQGYIFTGRTLVNIQHPDTGYVVISSISGSSDLKIHSIKLLPEFPTNVDEFSLLNIPNFDTTITSNSKLFIPVIFHPKNAGERICRIEIISDAYSGIENSKWDTSIVVISGIGYNKILQCEPLTFSESEHCKEHNGFIKIKNISDSVSAFLMKIENVSGDISAFKIQTDTIDNNFIILSPLDSILLPVRFNPSLFLKNNFECLYKVISDVDTSTGLIKGRSFKFPVIITMSSINDVAPGSVLRYDPPNSYESDFSIMADFSKVDFSYIKSFNLQLKFRKSELKFLNQVIKGELTENWNNLTSKIYDYDKDFSILEIIGYGNQILDGKSGILVKPQFMVLLSDTNFIEVELHKISFLESDKCIETSNSNGKITMSYCGDEVRKIILSKYMYDLKSTSANPNLSSETTINYSIPFQAITNIVIYNSYGEIVTKIVDGILSNGEYQYTLDNTNLSTGIYYVSMTSGPFSKVISFSIIK